MRLSNHCKADFDKEQLETDYGDDGGSEQGAFLFLTTLSDYVQCTVHVYGDCTDCTHTTMGP